MDTNIKYKTTWNNPNILNVHTNSLIFQFNLNTIITTTYILEFHLSIMK